MIDCIAVTTQIAEIKTNRPLIRQGVDIALGLQGLNHSPAIHHRLNAAELSSISHTDHRCIELIKDQNISTIGLSHVHRRILIVGSPANIGKTSHIPQGSQAILQTSIRIR